MTKKLYGKNNLTARQVVKLDIQELIANEITTEEYLEALDERGIEIKTNGVQK